MEKEFIQKGDKLLELLDKRNQLNKQIRKLREELRNNKKGRKEKEI